MIRLPMLPRGEREWIAELPIFYRGKVIDEILEHWPHTLATPAQWGWIRRAVERIMSSTLMLVLPTLPRDRQTYIRALPLLWLHSLVFVVEDIKGLDCVTNDNRWKAEKEALDYVMNF